MGQRTEKTQLGNSSARCHLSLFGTPNKKLLSIQEKMTLRIHWTPIKLLLKISIANFPPTGDVSVSGGTVM